MPATTSARLKLSPSPSAGLVEIGGHEISGCVGRVHVAAAPGSIPRLVLDLAVLEMEVDGEMTVTIPAETRTALIALGWTPPEGT